MAGVFERFTERARMVVVLAQDEARVLHHDYIGTEHLLLGLLREEEGLAAITLRQLGMTLEDVRERVVRIVGHGEMQTSGQIPFTPRAKKALENAGREAVSLGHRYIGTEHILLGLVHEDEGVAIRILAELDADPESVRVAVMQVMPGPSPRLPNERPQFRISCPTCGAELESVAADAPNTVYEVSAEGDRECPGCGSGWTISYRVAWKPKHEQEGS
jgi:ATP-dependent Clp protease ATP-binding subunit ClpA